MASNRDQSGTVVRTGHTVHLGSTVGLVKSVAKGRAMVHWIYGGESSQPCSRLLVVRSVGRIKPLQPARQDVPRFLMEAHP